MAFCKRAPEPATTAEAAFLAEVANPHSRLCPRRADAEINHDVLELVRRLVVVPSLFAYEQLPELIAETRLHEKPRDSINWRAVGGLTPRVRCDLYYAVVCNGNPWKLPTDGTDPAAYNRRTQSVDTMKPIPLISDFLFVNAVAYAHNRIAVTNNHKGVINVYDGSSCSWNSWRPLQIPGHQQSPWVVGFVSCASQIAMITPDMDSQEIASYVCDLQSGTLVSHQTLHTDLDYWFDASLISLHTELLALSESRTECDRGMWCLDVRENRWHPAGVARPWENEIVRAVGCGEHSVLFMARSNGNVAIYDRRANRFFAEPCYNWPVSAKGFTPDAIVWCE